MRLSTKQLLIVCNPFCAPLAPDGRATALLAIDPAEPMGSRYIGASTVAKAEKGRRSILSVGGEQLGRDKVSVTYSLAVVRVPDTSFYRAALKSGEAFDASEGVPLASLVAAAGMQLHSFIAEGSDREVALKAWRAQGLKAVADAMPAPKGALPPPSDELREAPGTGVPMTPIEAAPGVPATLTTEEVPS